MPIIRKHIVEPGLIIPMLALVMLFTLRCAWKRPLAWLGLHHLPPYPPAWVAGLIGFVLLSTFWTVHPRAFTAAGGTEADRFLLTYRIFPFIPLAWWHAILMILLAAVVVWRVERVRPTKRRRETRRTQPPPVTQESRNSEAGRLASDFEALKTWLRSDVEIDDPAMDAFGHDQVAKRIARRLINNQSSGEAGPTVALVGELGSGKSSIRNLVVRHLREDGLLERKIIVVSISLWPFDSPEAAVRGILNKLTEDLSRHVNATSITGLPEQYVQVIEHSGGRWSLPAQLLRGPSTPEAVLEQFERIATAIGLIVVLWIEDLERFAAAENLPGEGGGRRENERLAPIRSLLYLLDRKDRITVVLAANTLGPRFDMEKLARFIERPPRLDPQRFGAVLDFFRAECRGMLGRCIDPSPPQSRSSLNTLSPHEEAWLLRFRDRQTLRSALAFLCRTPRQVKQSLRAALDVWEQLVGEIDFDDVLVMSVLKIAEPKVFALVEEHIDKLRDGPRKNEKSSQDETFDKRLAETLSGDRRRGLKSIEAILDFVFPHRHSPPDPHSLPERPQGVAVDRHVSYWTRYLSVPSLTEQERDQPILESIDQWETDGQGSLPKLVADPERSEAVETFSRKMSPSRLNQLLRAVIIDRLREGTTKWPEDEHGTRKPPGIVGIWRILHRNRIDEEGLEATLQESVREVTGRNLALSDELMHYFATGESGVANLLSDLAISELRRSLETRLAQLSETEISDGLRGAAPFVLVRCCWSLDRLRKGNLDGLPFENWEGFANRLLDALESEPAVVLPQVLPFIVSKNESASSEEPVFDEELARRLFDYDRLLKLLREHLHADAVVHPHLEGVYKAVSDGILGK